MLSIPFILKVGVPASCCFDKKPTGLTKQLRRPTAHAMRR
jgi:hypothetical protein